MVPNIHLVAPLLPRGALLFLLLLTCLVFSSHADSMPRFVKSPEDQTGISGEVASFVCLATGEPKPRITWMKKGRIVRIQRFEIEFADGSVLWIQRLFKLRDEGIYRCTASNSAGKIKASAKLTVLEETQIPHGFPTIDMGPQLKVVEKTRTATMLCAASGNPDPEITWYKDMVPVDISSSNGRIRQLPSGALQIEISEESDQGKYECVALNSAGSRYSSPANLYVRGEVRNVPPRFSIPPTDQEVMPGGSVNLTCVAVGWPMPYVKWKTDITKEEDMPGRNVLEVINILVSANYTCVAVSPLGMIEATALVTVKAPSAPPQDVHLVSLSSTSLKVSWVAPPAASRHGAIVRYTVSYQAMAGEDTERHEVPDIGADASSQLLEGLEKWTEYQVWVRAHTDVGPGPESAPLRMKTREDVPGAPPRRLEVEAINSTAIRVTWKPPLQEKQHGQIRGYQVIFFPMENGELRGQPNIMDVALPEAQWNIEECTEHEAIIAGLHSETTYSVTVAAYTTKGDGARSKAKVITTIRAEPPPTTAAPSTTAPARSETSGPGTAADQHRASSSELEEQQSSSADDSFEAQLSMITNDSPSSHKARGVTTLFTFIRHIYLIYALKDKCFLAIALH